MTAVIDEAMQGTSLESIEIDESYRDPAPLPPGHTGEHWMRRMVPVIRPQLPLITLGLVAAVVSMILRVEVPNVVRQAIDDSLGAHPQHSLGHYALRLALMGVAILVVGITFRYSIQRAAFEMEYTLRVLLFRQFSKLSFSFYDRVQTG